MNLYYTALPVGQGCVPSLPLKYQVDNSCCSLTFFPQRCGTCGYRRPLEKGETVYDTQQIGVGKARAFVGLLSRMKPLTYLQSFTKGDQQLSRYQNSSQPNRMKSIFLAESCWLPIDCEPAACCSVFWTKIVRDVFHVQSGGNILTSSQGFLSADCWCMLWNLLKHWPNISGFHQFFLQ